MTTPESTQNKTPESVQKKFKGFEKLCTHAKNFKRKIKKALGLVSNEDGWNNFSEDQKQEMLDSLKMQDEFDLDSIDENRLFSRTNESIIMNGVECMVFGKNEIKKDSIGEYIEINGLKCREWQPGISGFTFQYNADKYHSGQRLIIGFCHKGEWIKQREINFQTHYAGVENCEYPDYATPSGVRRIRYLDEHYDEIQKEKEKKRKKRRQEKEEKRAKRKQKKGGI